MNKESFNIDKQYAQFVKQYRRYVPQFYHESKRIDIYPLLSYYGIYENNQNIIKLGPNAFLDKRTGWVLIILDRYGFKKSHKFYLQLFPNKRPGKRYVFGLKSNKKTILCAIATHISAKVDEQKHNKTKQYLRKAQLLMKKEINTDKNTFFFNMRKIDIIILKFIKKKKIKRFQPNWVRIYKLAKTARIFWKGF